MKKYAKHITAEHIAWGIVAIATFAVMGTYLLLTHTYDEPAHFITGLQWWTEGRYTLEPMHPPLARLMIAFPEFFITPLADIKARIGDSQGMFPMGWAYYDTSPDKYWHTLFLSRLGVLPFYIGCAAALLCWARHIAGIRVAIAALILFATLPVFSGNAGLATTDMPAAAMTFISLYLSMRWLEEPSYKHASWLGLSIGAMVCCKFSTLVQYPAALIPMAIFWFRTHGFAVSRQHIKSKLFVMLPIALFVVLALHFFNIDTIIKGIETVIAKNARGHAYWLFGPLHNQGVWYYFPVLLLVKTPLPFLILISWFFADMLRKAYMLPQAVWYPLLAVLGILCVSAFSDINIGVRHVMAVYPLLAIPAGYMLVKLWEKKKRIICSVLVGWQVLSFVAAYPNLFAYFNTLVLVNPGKISPGPDLDWGQDMYHIEKAIQYYDIRHLTLCNFFTRSSLSISLLSARIGGCTSNEHHVTGWFAVSLSKLAVDDRFAWLKNYTPVEKIGASYLLYHFK